MSIAVENINERFDAAFAIHRGSRLRKLMRGTVGIADSKLLEVLLKGLRLSMKRKANLVWGEEMTVVYPEIASLGLGRYGFFAEGLTKLVLTQVKPGNTFLDVGAQLGYFTLLAAWLVGDAGQVPSFEPTPQTFDILKLNAGEKPNVRLNQVAVAAYQGTATLNDYGPSFSAFNSMFNANLPQGSGRVRPTQVRVDTISIEEYVAERGLTPDFVKIDAENADFEILQGMESTIAKHHPTLSVEVGDMDIPGVPPSKDIVRFLQDRDYAPYEHVDGEFVAHEPRERYEHGDLYFLPVGSQRLPASNISASSLSPKA